MCQCACLRETIFLRRERALQPCDLRGQSILSRRRLAVGAVLLLAQILVLLRATMTGDHTLHRDAVLHARSVGDSGAAARSSRSQQAIRY
jgi:hypothetical protein